MKIGIIHPDLNSPGGADAVCLNTITALNTQHEISLITNREPNFEYLNSFFGTEVQVNKILMPPKSDVLNSISEITSQNFEIGLDRMKRAVLNRFAQNVSEYFDIFISTKNEIFIKDVPTVQYFHAPQYTGGSIPGVVGSHHPLLPLYDWVCQSIGRIDLEFNNSDRILANSQWTADMISKSYGINAEVVYPPVSPPEDCVPFEKREDGFLCIGRIDSNKGTHKVLNIIEKVIDRGHDTHLHIIGPAPSSAYAQRIQKRCKDTDWASYEGVLENVELNNMIGTHKYGIHGREYEHFGIAVAEMAMSGALPFVPNSGGQVEIVNNNDLVYDDIEEAVDNISEIMSNSEAQNTISEELSEYTQQFESDRFKCTIRQVVESCVQLT